MRWAILAYFFGIPLWLTLVVILHQMRWRSRGVAGLGLIDGVWAFLRGLVFNPTGLTLCMVALAFACAFPLASRVQFDLFGRQASCDSISLARRRGRTLRKLWAWIWPTLLAAAVAGVAVGASRFLVVGALSTFGLKLGIPLLILGLRSRIGPFLTCARCGYRMSSWRRAKDPCPECGNLWKQPWGAALGVPGIRWRLVAIGAVLQLASLLAMVWLIWRLR